MANCIRRLRSSRAAGWGGLLSFALMAVAMAWDAPVRAMAAQAASESSQGVKIQGTLADTAGKAIGNVLVRLERKGVAGATETRSDASGSFEFSALGPGTYILTAEDAGMRGSAALVIASATGNPRHVDLVLKDLTGGLESSSQSPGQAMEFADEPTFTVAGVTDWTAAGGHGSDATLRTSEALTRETLKLKQGSAAPDGQPQSSNQHRLAGERAEKMGDPLAAVHEFEQAVREDPSEQNYFEWGSELLLHRAVMQAREVFDRGAKAYPKSERMLTALGAALFAGALYDEAALRLCDASDLSPSDPEPYIFMGKIELAAPNPLACVEQKLARFAELQPGNALANYFYAMTVWKQQGSAISEKGLQQVETSLTKAVSLDASCADAYLQLGVLNFSRREYQKAIGFYSKALAANPQMSEAHYRLAMAYDRVGEREKARQEIQLHDEIAKQQAAQVDRDRREVKQFLVIGPEKPADSEPQPK